MEESKKKLSKKDILRAELKEQHRVHAGLKRFEKAIGHGYFPAAFADAVPQGMKFLSGVIDGIETRVKQLKQEIKNVQEESPEEVDLEENDDETQAG